MPVRLATCLPLLVASLAASACAQTPTLERSSSPPPLRPLAMSIGGRVLTTPGISPTAGFPQDYISQWPGTYFEAAFKGADLYFRVGKAHEILHVAVDGQPPLVLTDPEAAVYRLAGLAKQRHTVTVAVATESQPAPNTFGGFALPPHEKPLTPPQHARQIEFIGDSHTVGYGNTSPKGVCSPEEVWSSTDDTQAFGALTAGHYHAAYQVNAISGRGIVRNANSSAGAKLPEAYPYILFDKQQTYADPAWRPQILVISLGTNDFSTALNPTGPWKSRDALHDDFEATYVRFLETLRTRNPNAYIILWATNLFHGEIESEVTKVVQQATAQGETRLTFLPMDPIRFTGCHSHPSLADDQAIRDKLIRFIDATPGIWQGKYIPPS